MYGLFVEAIYDVEYSVFEPCSDRKEIQMWKDDMLLRIYSEHEDDAENHCLAEADREIYQTNSPNFKYSVRKLV